MANTAMVVAMIAATTLSTVSACNIPFRAPAIPLITTDPFMQTWIRGDNSTADVVTHWDGTKKEMLGMIRVDGVSYRFLGACSTSDTPPKGATGKYQENTDCSGDDLPLCGGGGCTGYPTVESCEAKCNSTDGCTGYVFDPKDCDGMSKGNSKCWLKGSDCSLRANAPCRNYKYLGNHGPSDPFTCPPALESTLVQVHPTRTTFVMKLAGKVELNLTFLSTMFTDDYTRLSRPVYYAQHEVKSLDGVAHSIQLHLDMSGEHSLNVDSQEAQWKSWTDAGLKGVQIGNAVQNTVGSKGDRVNIDWGFLHMAVPTNSTATLKAGSLINERKSFVASGGASPTSDTRQPRALSDDLPGLSQTKDLGSIMEGAHTVLIAYEDVDSVLYFGTKFKAFWTQQHSSMADAMMSALGEEGAMLDRSVAHDNQLVANLTAHAGDKYACVCSLAYRQTLAATKLVWNSEKKVMWNFLKEISTNGDMQTMDVIYPGSPMLLYTNPELLKLLLVPVLSYAANETYIRFGNPYSPHQLGTYPVADCTTAQQEPMPLENSGNMLFMLLKIIAEDPNHDVSFLEPTYFPMLKTWADELVRTLPYPANQICTDDFTGKLANNSNLGAKGIVALEAFAQICRYSKTTSVDCEMYSSIAKNFSNVWIKFSEASSGMPHYKISYNFPDDSWSLKYNLLWQKLLDLDGPFDLDAIVAKDIPYYKSKMNKYGVPLDGRHTYVKTDWLSWAAALANTDEDFHAIMDPIFDFANETPTRVPFTDLYDTITSAAASGGFIARPVMGGLFAKMLLK